MRRVVQLLYASSHAAHMIVTNCITDATHIYDGLDDFPTHIAHMHLGSMVTPPSPWPILPESPLSAQFTPFTPLYSVALQWLREDRDKRRELERHGLKTRGARRNQVSCGYSVTVQID